MRPMSRFVAMLGVTTAIAGAAWGQPNFPTIVNLPTDDFVWPWGNMRPIDDADDPDFTLSGVERSFRCTAKGAFKPGSHMTDTFAKREFEQSLNGSIYFIQEATARLNQLDASNDLQWALMECIIPDASDSEEDIQEELDRALERAQRERDKRRERAAEEREAAERDN